MELAAASVTRSIELPVPAEEAWSSLRDPDGLSGWLGEVDLPAIEPGAAGAIIEGGTVRRLIVTEVDEGRLIGFVWWEEGAPADASVVTIAVSPADDGETSTLTVTERLAGGVVASMGEASVADLAASAGGAWDRRLRALVGEAALADASV